MMIDFLRELVIIVKRHSLAIKHRCAISERDIIGQSAVVKTEILSRAAV